MLMDDQPKAKFLADVTAQHFFAFADELVPVRVLGPQNPIMME
jgi:hypothetical protein